MGKAQLCGNFGCTLPNLHRGLCRPVIGKRGSRNAPARSAGRMPTSYVQRVVPKPKKPERKLVPVGTDHQVHGLPQWCTGVCDAAYNRGDELLAMETKRAIQAAFTAEREAAAAWEAGQELRSTSSADLSHLFKHLPSDGLPEPLAPLKDANVSTTPVVLPCASTPTRDLAGSESPVHGTPVALLATKAMVATPIKKPTLGAVQGIAVHRLSASVKTQGSTLAVQAS